MKRLLIWWAFLWMRLPELQELLNRNNLILIIRRFFTNDNPCFTGETKRKILIFPYQEQSQINFARYTVNGASNKPKTFQYTKDTYNLQS